MFKITQDQLNIILSALNPRMTQAESFGVNVVVAQIRRQIAEDSAKPPEAPVVTREDV
jgi:hypothetical protein